MNLFAISGLFCFAAALGLGIFSAVIGREKLHRMWAAFNFAVAMWGLSAFGFGSASEPETALLWIRIGHIGAILIPVLYLHFVFELLQYKNPLVIKAVYLFGCFLQLINLTDWFGITKLFIVDLRYVFNQFYVDSPPGALYPLFVAFFFVVVGYGLYQAQIAYKLAEGKKREQIKLFIWSTVIGFSGGGTAFLMVFQIDVYPIWHFAIGFYPIILTYAIFRYQFLDIKVIVKRTLVFAGLVGSVVCVVSMMTFVSQGVLDQYVTVPRWVSNILAAVIIAATYGRLRDWLVNVTDRYLFQKKYDYKELLKRFADEVMIIVEIKELTKRTVITLTDTIKNENTNLLLFNKDSGKYELAASRGWNGHKLELEENEPFVTFFRETHEPIGTEGELGKIKFPEAVTNRVKQLDARLCLPLYVHDELKGVLCLGKKKSDEEYGQEDLDILLPLSKTLGIAISNAQLFDELAKTQADAAQKEKLAVIGTLSAGINHEICNPLGIVKAQCEAFLLDREDGILKDVSPEEMLERTTSILRGAVKQIDRATAITQKLSNFARPINNPTVERIDIEHEVDEVLALVVHDLKLDKVDVKKEIWPGIPKINVDRRQLQEVLFNLIRNAGQAISGPGSITIRAANQNGHVRVEITDTGTGISKEKLEKIFDPFFTTKEPGKGTGLGLFIVRQIVERNKGKISVESEPGQGAKFILDFPVAEQAFVKV